MHIDALGATLLMHTLFPVYIVRLCPSHILRVTTYLLNFYCSSIDMLLAEVYACVCMDLRKLVIKGCSIFKTFLGNIITFFNLTVCQVC